MSTPSYYGSCLCGAIHYEIKVLGDHIVHCHCSMCRKFHGTGFATLAEVPIEYFQWLKGQEYLNTYTAPNGTQRSFCRQCGSSLTLYVPHLDAINIEVAIGTLDTLLDKMPDCHIFVESKADWVGLCDELPQFPTDYFAYSCSEKLNYYL